MPPLIAVLNCYIQTDVMTWLLLDVITIPNIQRITHTFRFNLHRTTTCFAFQRLTTFFRRLSLDFISLVGGRPTFEFRRSCASCSSPNSRTRRGACLESLNRTGHTPLGCALSDTLILFAHIKYILRQIETFRHQQATIVSLPHKLTPFQNKIRKLQQQKTKWPILCLIQLQVCRSSLLT